MPRGAPLQDHELAAAVQAARNLGSLRSVWLRLPAASAAARADTLAPIFAKIDTLMICREPPGDEQGSSPKGLFGLPERDPAALSLPPLLPNLELLVLEACELNPADLRQIASCDQLAQLDLYRCAVRCNNLNRLAGAKSLQNLHLLNMDWVELPYNSNGDLMGKQFLKPSDLAARAGREQFFPADRNQRPRELLPGVATLHQYVVDDYVIQSIPLAPSRQRACLCIIKRRGYLARTARVQGRLLRLTGNGPFCYLAPPAPDVAPTLLTPRGRRCALQD